MHLLYDADKQDLEILRVFLLQESQKVRFDCRNRKSGERIVVDLPRSSCTEMLFDYLENFAGAKEKAKFFEATGRPATFDCCLRSDSDELAVTVAEFRYRIDTYWIQIVCTTTDGNQVAPLSFAGDWRSQFLLAIAWNIGLSVDQIRQSLKPAQVESL